MAIIGIDLGTTFSAVGYLDKEGVPQTVVNGEGEAMTPSVVLVEGEEEAIVGRDAKRAAAAEPGRVAQDVKRHLGEEYYPRLIGGKQYSPVMLSAMILRKLRQDAEAETGSVEGAVITVPAYFDEGRRQATAEAGRMAGMAVLDILNEPTAAALAYAYRALREGKGAEGEARTLLVYDLGGGTFDVTLLKARGNALSVMATAGDIALGGRDWDERVFQWLAGEFLRVHGEEPRDDAQSVEQFMQAAEQLKKDLSARAAARFVVTHGGKSLRGEMGREGFEKMTADLLFRTESRITRVIREAGLAWKDVDQVLCAGGSSRMPQVGAMLERVTGRKPDRTLSPDEAVAHGAAIHAAALVVQQGDQLGAKEGGKLPVAVRGFSEKALGLLRELRTTSVNAYSLGVVAENGQGERFVSHLIARNTALPAEVTRKYATVKEGQSQVIVQVVEGESKAPGDCVVLGVCRIGGLPAGLPKGSPVEVTFRYDGSGRLQVAAVHVGSGKRAETRIERRRGLEAGRLKEHEASLAKVRVS